MHETSRILVLFVLLASLILLFGCTGNPPQSSGSGERDVKPSPENPPQTKANETSEPPGEIPPRGEPGSGPKTIGKAEIVNLYWYDRGNGYYWLTGQVQNTGETPVKADFFTLNYKNKEGNNVSSVGGAPVYLAPGQKHPFWFRIEIKGIDDINKMTWEIGEILDVEPHEPGLVVLSNNLSRYESYYWENKVGVWADVRKVRADESQWKEGVMVTFYDAQGRVVASDGPSNIQRMPEGESGSFLIETEDTLERVVASYDVVPYSYWSIYD